MSDGSNADLSASDPRSWISRSGRVSWSLIGIALVAVAVLMLMVWLRDLVVPLVLAGFLAIVFAPAVAWCAQRRISRSVGAVFAILMIFLVLAGSVYLVVNGVIDRSSQLTAALDKAGEQLQTLLERWNLDDAFDDFADSVTGSADAVGGGIDLGAGLTSAVGSVAGIASGTILGIVLLYYLLKDGPRLTDDSIGRLPADRRDAARRIADQAAQTIRRYFRGRTILALAQGAAVAVVLWAMGVPLPLAIGIVNVIGAYIPYLGAFIGGAFAVLMALAEGGVGLAIAALGVVLFVNLVLENVLEPALMGSSLDMHPIAVLLVTVGGGVTGGLLGLILAAPAAAVAVQIYREVTSSRPDGSSGADRSPAPDDTDR